MRIPNLNDPNWRDKEMNRKSVQIAFSKNFIVYVRPDNKCMVRRYAGSDGAMEYSWTNWSGCGVYDDYESAKRYVRKCGEEVSRVF